MFIRRIEVEVSGLPEDSILSCDILLQTGHVMLCCGLACETACGFFAL